jgi:chloramphenicol 3-O-phosphotransferase
MASARGRLALSLVTGPGEPAVRWWQPSTFRGLAEGVRSACGDIARRPAIVAVDGRSGAGKSSIARALVDTIPASAVVHTDDIAWYESFFGWDDVLVSHVLAPLRASERVNYRPDSWERRGREGSIEVPSGRSMVVLEGCGAGRRALAPYLDALVWVQSDDTEAERRGVMRDGGTEQARRFWREWQAQEVPFFIDDCPWLRADLIVCGTPGASLPPGTDLLVAAGDSAR